MSEDTVQKGLQPPRPDSGSVPREPEGDRRWYLPRTFDALRFKPFRWYMGAMIGWNAAMSMQLLVRGYLAYQLTGSFASLGIVSLGVAIPMLFLSPVGGVIADRTSRRGVLQIGQVFSFVIAVTIAALLFADVLKFWHLVVASLAHGLMVALVMPSRQALLPEIVGTQRLMNAIPLQLAGTSLMQILAPALGGFMIDWLGAEWVYVFMAAMYAMSVLMLFFVESRYVIELDVDDDVHSERSSAMNEVSHGFRYLLRDRTVLSVMAFTSIGSVLGMPIRLILPGYVGAVFDDRGSTLGLMQVGMAIGALVGSLGLASLRMTHHRGWLLAGSSMLVGIALVGFSLSGMFWLAWLALLVVGIGSAGRVAVSQVLVQEYVAERYRGRMMSIFMMQFGLMSIGAFIVSLYMEWVGPEFAIGTLGVILIIATIIYMRLVPRLRHLD